MIRAMHLTLIFSFFGMTLAHTKASVARDKFEYVKARIIDHYSNDLKDRGLRLIVEDRLEDRTVNAYSRVFAGRLVVTIFGGLVEQPGIGTDELGLVACHLLGQYMGGAPLRNISSTEKYPLSSKTQADYWASAKCMKKIFGDEHDADLIDVNQLDPTLVQMCYLVYKMGESTKLCVRTALAALKLTNFFKTLKKETGVVSLFTPDRSSVDLTSERYPNLQCRLDNYFQGALCDVQANSQVSSDNPSVGFCSRSDGRFVGVRPRCWFNPPSP